MNEPIIQQIEQSIDELVEICDHLRKENYALRQAQSKNTTQYSRLVEKQQTVQAKIESMLLRLKTERG